MGRARALVRPRPKLWKSVIDELEVAQEKTKNNKTIDVVFCLNYGGRAEIADAARPSHVRCVTARSPAIV